MGRQGVIKTKKIGKLVTYALWIIKKYNILYTVCRGEMGAVSRELPCTGMESAGANQALM